MFSLSGSIVITQSLASALIAYSASYIYTLPRSLAIGFLVSLGSPVFERDLNTYQRCSENLETELRYCSVNTDLWRYSSRVSFAGNEPIEARS